MALPVSADGEPTSASRIRPSSESSTMCHHSKLNGTAFGIHDWLNYLWDQAAMCRKLVEQADDPFIKTELLSLASVCEEIADNIEDHLTGGADHAPPAPCARPSCNKPATRAGLHPLTNPTFYSAPTQNTPP